MINPSTGFPMTGGGIDMMGNPYGFSSSTSSFSNGRLPKFLEEKEIELTPEQLAKIQQEIAEEKERLMEIERNKSKLQKFIERYIHFF